MRTRPISARHGRGALPGNSRSHLCSHSELQRRAASANLLNRGPAEGSPGARCLLNSRRPRVALTGQQQIPRRSARCRVGVPEEERCQSLLRFKMSGLRRRVRSHASPRKSKPADPGAIHIAHDLLACSQLRWEVVEVGKILEILPLLPASPDRALSSDKRLVPRHLAESGATGWRACELLFVYREIRFRPSKTGPPGRR